MHFITNNTAYDLIKIAEFYQNRNYERKKRGLFCLFPSSYSPSAEDDDYEEEDLPLVYPPYLPPKSEKDS